MDEQTINNFGKGAYYSPDIRDFIFGAVVPIPYDWTSDYKFTVPITPSSQFTSLSCVGQTTMNMAKIAYFTKFSTLKDFSARYIYSQIALPGGGAYGQDGLHILVDQGIEQNADFDSEPETEAHMRDKTGIDPLKAKPYDIYTDSGIAYAWVSNNIDTVAEAIRDHGSVMLLVAGSNQGWTSATVRPPFDGETIWGHAITGVEPQMKDGKKVIKFLNSWSPYWGDNGYGYLDEDYFKSGRVMAVYVLTDNFIVPQVPMLKLVIHNKEQYLRDLDGNDYHIVNVDTLKDLFAAKVIATLVPEPVSTVNYTGKEFLVFTQTKE